MQSKWFLLLIRFVKSLKNLIRKKRNQNFHISNVFIFKNLIRQKRNQNFHIFNVFIFIIFWRTHWIGITQIGNALIIYSMTCTSNPSSHFQRIQKKKKDLVQERLFLFFWDAHWFVFPLLFSLCRFLLRKKTKWVLRKACVIIRTC